MTRRLNKPEDFWKYVDKTSNPNGCWKWTGYTDPKGYGRFQIQKLYFAHRFSMLLAGHNIEGWHILHSCDNPPCVNPDHLSLGTHADNMRDMKNKGRLKMPTPKRKISDDDIRIIRTSPKSNKELALEYNFKKPCFIQDIRDRKKYKSVV